jgi:hypothetical protein
MNRVIHSDRSGIVRDHSIQGAQRAKFRMPILKTLDVHCVMRHSAVCLQISVALRAGLIPRRNKIHPTSVFGVARRATN